MTREGVVVELLSMEDFVGQAEALRRSAAELRGRALEACRETIIYAAHNQTSCGSKAGLDCSAEVPGRRRPCGPCALRRAAAALEFLDRLVAAKGLEEVTP